MSYASRRGANTAGGSAAVSPDFSAILFSPGYVFGEPSYDIESGGIAVAPNDAHATPPPITSDDGTGWIEAPASETTSPISSETGSPIPRGDGVWYPLYNGSHAFVVNAPDGIALTSLWFPSLAAPVGVPTYRIDTGEHVSDWTVDAAGLSAYLDLHAGIGGGVLLRRIWLANSTPELVPLPRGIGNVTLSLHALRVLTSPSSSVRFDDGRPYFMRPIDLFASSLHLQPGGPGWGGALGYGSPPPPTGIH